MSLFDKKEELKDDAALELEEGASYDPERDKADLLKALLSTDDEVFKNVPMPRFGEDACFVVKGISSEAYAKLEKRCKYPVKDKRTRTITEKVDQDKLSYLLINEACISPDWSDPKLLQKYNTEDPVSVIRKRLLLGEVTALTQAIMDASGFTDEVEEIKN